MIITKIKVSESKLGNLFPLESFMTFKDLPPLSWDEVLKYQKENEVKYKEINDNRFYPDGSIKKIFLETISPKEVRDFWLKRLSYFSNNPYYLGDNYGEVSIIKLKENVTDDWVLESGVESLALHINNNKKPLFIEGDEKEALKIVVQKNILETIEENIESIEKNYQEIILDKIEIYNNEFKLDWVKGDINTFVKELGYFNQESRDFKHKVFDGFFEGEILRADNFKYDGKESKNEEENKAIRKQLNIFMSEAFDYWLILLDKEKEARLLNPQKKSSNISMFGSIFFNYFLEHMIPDIEVKSLKHIASRKNLFETEYSRKKKSTEDINGFADYEFMFDAPGVSKDRIEEIWGIMFQNLDFVKMKDELLGYRVQNFMDELFKKKNEKESYNRYNSRVFEREGIYDCFIFEKVMDSLIKKGKIDKDTHALLHNDIKILSELISQQIVVSNNSFFNDSESVLFNMEFLGKFAQLDMETKILSLHIPTIDNSVKKLCCDTENYFIQEKSGTSRGDYNEHNDNAFRRVTLNNRVITNQDRYFEMMNIIGKLMTTKFDDNYAKLTAHFQYEINKSSELDSYFQHFTRKGLTFSLQKSNGHNGSYFLSEDVALLENNSSKQNELFKKIKEILNISIAISDIDKNEGYLSEITSKVLEVFKMLNINNKKEIISIMLSDIKYQSVGYGLISTLDKNDAKDFKEQLGLSKINDKLVTYLLMEFNEYNKEEYIYNQNQNGVQKIHKMLTDLDNNEKAVITQNLISILKGKNADLLDNAYIKVFMTNVFEQNIINVSTLSEEDKFTLIDLMDKGKLNVSEKLINKILLDVPEKTKNILDVIENKTGSLDFKDSFVKKILNLDEFLNNRSKYPKIMSVAVSRIVEKNIKKENFDNKLWFECIVHALDTNWNPESIVNSINIENPLYAVKLLDCLKNFMEKELHLNSSRLKDEKRSNNNIYKFLTELMKVHKGNAVVVQKLYDTIEVMEGEKEGFEFMNKFKSMLPEEVRIAEKTVPLNLIFRDMVMKNLLEEEVPKIEKRTVGVKKKI